MLRVTTQLLTRIKQATFFFFLALQNSLSLPQDRKQEARERGTLSPARDETKQNKKATEQRDMEPRVAERGFSPGSALPEGCSELPEGCP